MCGPKINPIASWEHKLFLKSSFQEFRMSRNICGLFLDFGNTAEMRNLLFTSPTCAASDCPNVFVALWVHFFEAPLKANRLGYMDDALQLSGIVCLCLGSPVSHRHTIINPQLANDHSAVSQRTCSCLVYISGQFYHVDYSFIYIYIYI